jgi:hypothetical protein
MILRLTLLCGLWLGLVSAAAPQATPGTASVSVTVAADGARASVALDRPATRFAFASGDMAWDGYAELLTPGLTLKGRVVEGAAPFRRFEVRLRPSSDEHDGKYPVFYRLGDGGVVHAPAFLADGNSWRTVLHFVLAPGQVRYPARGKVQDGSVFIGPAKLVTVRKGFVAVAAPDVPAWLADLARSDVEAAVRYYGAALRRPLPTKPLLLLNFQPAERSTYVGDVTPGPVVGLRFHGGAWEKPDAQAARGIHVFIDHEGFHFWNGGLTRPADGAPTWLHEGGAEYAALLAGAAAGLVDDTEARRRLGEALNRCRFALRNAGDKGLAQVGFLSNQLRYPCGMVLQWAVDLHVRRAGTGRTVMDVWADTIAAALRHEGRTYALADFYAAAGIADTARFAPAALLVDTSGPERWRTLPAVLEALGAEIGTQVTSDGRRGVLLFHLLGQSCPPGTRRGYYADRQIRLQTTEGCGVLAGDPVLKAVEGGDPFAPSAETYAAVQRRCAASEPVTLTTMDGRTIAAPCGKALGPPPEDYAVRRWLPPGAAVTGSPVAKEASRRP